MTNPTQILKYPVSYRLLDVGNMYSVPRPIDDGMCYLCTPKNIYIRDGQYKEIKMGLVLQFPAYIRLPLETADGAVVQSLHCRIDSCYDLLLSRGIQVISPTVLSPAYDPVELRLYITSIKPGNHTIKAGEPIATLSFVATPPIVLGINQSISFVGEKVCAPSQSTKKPSK